MGNFGNRDTWDYARRTSSAVTTKFGRDNVAGIELETTSPPYDSKGSTLMDLELNGP